MNLLPRRLYGVDASAGEQLRDIIRGALRAFYHLNEMVEGVDRY